ncbi:MAG: flavodoxin family protein [Schaedlerella sp.]|nr:flavodoxin family protein [Schaedlerella sp.]
MKKKTLIINGSPRKNGDTVALINELKKYLVGEVIEISAYRSKISPCMDCRQCTEDNICRIKDEMELIYKDDFDNIVLASPVYYAAFPGPVLSLLSRFQNLHTLIVNGKFPDLRSKKAGLIVTGGGAKNNYEHAIRHARILFRMTNAKGFEDYMVKSVKTDFVPAAEDKEALKDCKKLAEWLNE